jgi:hypothetical protein
LALVGWSDFQDVDVEFAAGEEFFEEQGGVELTAEACDGGGELFGVCHDVVLFDADAGIFEGGFDDEGVVASPVGRLVGVEEGKGGCGQSGGVEQMFAGSFVTTEEQAACGATGVFQAEPFEQGGGVKLGDRRERDPFVEVEDDIGAMVADFVQQRLEVVGEAEGTDGITGFLEHRLTFGQGVKDIPFRFVLGVVGWEDRLVVEQQD